MIEVVVTAGAISHTKLQSDHHHQQTNIQFFYRPDALPVAQPTVHTITLQQLYCMMITWIAGMGMGT